ncbi:MAG: alpha/beta hydrolase [Caldilineaceae bacterium]
MPPIEKYINMGGYALYSRSSGVGKPAVVFEGGLGDDSAIWNLVEPIVAKRTTTVVYDRAGLGRSSKATSPRTFVNIVADLNTVLEQLPIEPPYILVGHSLGGLLVRLYAASYPEAVTGVVLVDAPHEHQTEAARKILSPQAWSVISRFWSQNPEDIGLVTEMNQLEMIATRPEIPLRVLTATVVQSWPFDLPKAIAQELESVATRVFPAFQTKLLETSKRSQLIRVENADHYIHLRRPDVVIEEIDTLLSLVQGHEE